VVGNYVRKYVDRMWTSPVTMRSIGAVATVFLLGASCATLAVLSLTSGREVHATAPAGHPTVSSESTRSNSATADIFSLHTPDNSGGLKDADIAELNLRCAEGLPGAEELDIDATLAELDRWAEHVRTETQRHLYRFRSAPEEYENSEAYFRMLMLIVVLQGDLGVQYNPERIDEPEFTNSKDLFIHGMINSDNGGTCVSMPVLYVAVGRRLGYPLHLVVTKGHVFARWDAPNHQNPKFRGRFNIEGTNRGLTTYDDEHYRQWPHMLSDAERNNKWFLKSLTPAESVALFLMQRGHCMEDNGDLHDAQVAYALAHRLTPQSPEALSYLAKVVHREMRAQAGVDQDVNGQRVVHASQSKWLKRKRREAEEIARRAVERGRRRTPNEPPTPTFEQPVLPPTPPIPGGGNP